LPILLWYQFTCKNYMKAVVRKCFQKIKTERKKY
jgi:hypothetical protein